jgi:subtilisin family serine protease
VKRKLPWLLSLLIIVALVGFPAAALSEGPQPPDRVEPAPRGLPDALLDAGQAPLVDVEGQEVIPGDYIVVLKKGVPDRVAQAIIDRSVTGMGGRLLHRYTAALNGFAASLPDAALENLQRNPTVSFIEPDTVVTISGSQSPATWGIDRVDQRDLPLDNSYTFNTTGAGVHAYIIDTGLHYSHAEFSGRASFGYDSLGGNGSDCHGHGTHVGSTVGGETYGVAKDVNLYAVRVLNCSGSGSTSGVIAGVDWVTANHNSPAVANMSLGGSASTSLDSALRNSIAAGVTYAVAAGNNNRSACNYSPARVDEALTVGSTTSSDARSSFSNYGSCVDIFAPGSSITSAWYTSDTATNTISGTSMASPHTAGVAALYLEANPSASPSQVFSAIVDGATSGRLSSIGSGSPNLLLYSLLTSGDPGPNPTPTPSPTPTPDPGGAPCSDCEQYSGTLSGAGDYDYQPNGNYYYSGSGTHQGWLEGPAGTDFDLYLLKWAWFRWTTVASSTGTGSSESISYNGSSGYYLWRVESYSGSGSYDFWLDRP